MPPNTREEVESNRKSCKAGWSATPYETPTYFEDELRKLIHNRIVVHGFYVKDRPYVKDAFEDIARRTGGKSAFLRIEDERGGDQLIDLMSEIVCHAVGSSGGDVGQGQALVNLYRDMFGRGFTLD